MTQLYKTHGGRGVYYTFTVLNVSIGIYIHKTARAHRLVFNLPTKTFHFLDTKGMKKKKKKTVIILFHAPLFVSNLIILRCM